MVATVFIDGEAGTTGLQIRERLAGRRDIDVVSIDPAARRDPSARRERFNDADVVILCLPDEAAREAVGLVDNETARIIDASSAHRTAPGWTYGFPEMARGQRDAIAASRRVSNPGCYPTGFIALVRPLVVAELLPAAWPVTVNAVSGYSGGGRATIAQFEDPASPSRASESFRLYGLDLNHKHVPEMQFHAGLTVRPLFAPAVGRYRQGMIVEVPLQLYALPEAPGITDIHGALSRAYADEPFVEVASLEKCASRDTLDPESLNGTNRMKLYTFGSEALGQALLVAVLDNLGKGAAGAAVQNLNLMLGLPEGASL
ncbi:MAG: N-acetyl-gamma-glutamyl-phosphate reductase [Pseudomonadota bacterium]|nr:N-acetyl-gamma-glutamyl-phosphate reductase [Pseudomonadota bacterium]